MVVDVQGENPYQSSPDPSHFRPLRTKRDELIEATTDVLIKQKFEEDLEMVAEALYDAGLLGEPADKLLNDFAKYLSERCGLSVQSQAQAFLRERNDDV